MTKTVIVTGGCGYIGSHISRAFKYANDKNQVHVIDRVARNHTLKNIDSCLLEDFASVAGLQWIVNLKPDIIVHCAGTSLVGPSMLDPAEYYDNNVSKTIQLLNAIKDAGLKTTILFSSSAAVYGNPIELPITENHPLNPISPYGNTKAIIETVFKDYFNAYGINSTCFRFFNAAGAMPSTADLGQEPGATHIVARALEASLAGQTFTINGNDFTTPDGTCVRDYIHVWDLAMAHIKAIDYIELNPGAHIFNLGTNTGTSNKEIADIVQKQFGFKSLEYGDRRSGDPDELVADATRAKELLTWTPDYSTIDNIIEDAYKWYLNKL
jgi:UDP-glucose 4-epimerase